MNQRIKYQNEYINGKQNIHILILKKYGLYITNVSI